MTMLLTNYVLALELLPLTISILSLRFLAEFSVFKTAIWKTTHALASYIFWCIHQDIHYVITMLFNCLKHIF